MSQIDENLLGGATDPQGRTEVFGVKGSKRFVERGAREMRGCILLSARDVQDGER